MDRLRRQRGARSTRIRPVSSEPVSLAAERLAAGHAIVEPRGKRSACYGAIKRAADVFAAVGLLILFSPIMLAVFLILMVTTRGKPIFRQERLGYLGRPFQMYKFRTMSLDADRRRDQVVNEKDGPIFKNRRDPRITRIGRFLRSSSIDEMPQLFNVLAGQMSLVGPRPPISMEAAKYEPWQRQRLAVKPGLTCLWQVSGRSEIAFETWGQNGPLVHCQSEYCHRLGATSKDPLDRYYRSWGILGLVSPANCPPRSFGKSPSSVRIGAGWLIVSLGKSLDKRSVHWHHVIPAGY